MPGAEGDGRWSALKLGVDQDEPVVAEKHRIVDEDRRRSEAAALDQLVGVRRELLLVIGSGNLAQFAQGLFIGSWRLRTSCCSNILRGVRQSAP